MTVRPASVASALRTICALSALSLTGLVLAPAPASASPEENGRTEPALHRHRDARPVEGHQALPHTAIVSGYLPRNNNVPMYNEPPKIGALGGPAW